MDFILFALCLIILFGIGYFTLRGSYLWFRITLAWTELIAKVKTFFRK